MAISGGDARKLLNAIELIVKSSNNKNEIIITNKLAREIIQENLLNYDKKGKCTMT